MITPYPYSNVQSEECEVVAAYYRKFGKPNWDLALASNPQIYRKYRPNPHLYNLPKSSVAQAQRNIVCLYLLNFPNLQQKLLRFFHKRRIKVFWWRCCCRGWQWRCGWRSSRCLRQQVGIGSTLCSGWYTCRSMRMLTIRSLALLDQLTIESTIFLFSSSTDQVLPLWDPQRDPSFPLF